jgi:hypothetical protein
MLMTSGHMKARPTQTGLPRRLLSRQSLRIKTAEAEICSRWISKTNPRAGKKRKSEDRS